MEFLEEALLYDVTALCKSFIGCWARAAGSGKGKALRHYLNSCRRRRPNKILHPVRPVTPFTPPYEGSCISVFGAGIVLLLGGKGRRNVTRAGSSYFRCVMDVNIPPLLQFSCHFRRNSLLLLVFRAAPPLSMERARARFTCSVHP